MDALTTVVSFLGELAPAAASATRLAEGAIVLPLRGPVHAEPELRSLSDALRAEEIVVEETKQPRVQALRVRSMVDLPVFIGAGGLLRGGGQNRIVASPKLVLPFEEAELSVTCVERGRWTASRDRSFRRSESAPHSVSSPKRLRESRARRSGLDRASDQSDTWQDVASALQRDHIRSPTSDLVATARHRRHRVRAALREASQHLLPEWQACDTALLAAFRADGRLLGLDGFGVGSLLPGLGRSLEAWALDHGAPQPTQPEPRWLDGLASLAGRLAHPSEPVMKRRGELDLVELSWEGLPYSGTAVVWQDHLLQLTVEVPCD